MAKNASVWGIEIGQSALKALKCRLDGDTVIAEAFDYIEYPKILSQPEAEPEVLVREALETFISRNDLKKCRVGVSVPGQSGLAKFFKPPPVEMKKIPDIVKYEAKQQIPFDLNDVIWDYQTMAGGSVEDGFALETEVGLFAMKRDAVYRALKPLQTAGIEVDLIQLAPLSIYNMITYDRLEDPEAGQIFDADHPPKSLVVLAMGTDATDLIITNGYRVWQRNMPLGGNHFTRQLTKDLKLTFAKAEHLKRNAMEAEDPKLVFQAMRPVFNDLVTEVQRSMGFFKSLNKKADLSSIVMLGNTVKLPGLASYLNKNLGMDVEVMEKFVKLSGDEVLAAPSFKEHQAAFGPVYGLCLQLLGCGPAHTNLVPKEILKERLIRSKKPWVVAAAAALLIGFVINLMFRNQRTVEVAEEKWKPAITAATSTKSMSDSEKNTHKTKVASVDLLTKVGQEVSGSADRRLLWLEMLKVISSTQGRPEVVENRPAPTPLELPYYERPEIHITKIDCKYYKEVSTWYTSLIASSYEEDKRTRLERLNLVGKPGDANAPAADAPAEAAPAGDAGGGPAPGAPTGPGWVVQIDAYHYHNIPEKNPEFPDEIKKLPNYKDNGDEAEDFVLKTMIHKLETGTIAIPVGGKPVLFTMEEMGISKPFVIPVKLDPKHREVNPEYQRLLGPQAGGMGTGSDGGSGTGIPGGPSGGAGSGMGSGMMGVGSGGGGGLGSGSGAGPGGMRRIDPKIPPSFPAPKYEFKVQFVWQEKLLSVRVAEQEKKKAEEAAKAAEGQQNQENAAPAEGNVAVN